MGRRKVGLNRSLPRGLRVRNGYYSYRNPVTGIEVGVGRDRHTAVVHAVTNNVAVGAMGRHPPAEGLLAETDIVASAAPLTSLSGIYFLISGAAIVYVGQSINVHYRLAEHVARKAIVFDRYYAIPCPETELDHLEALYIATFRPKYNRDLRICLVGSPNP